MNSCFLSFIVPVYNAQTHLSACLDSLLNQDLPKDTYEIVCVNDGSRDESTAILREYLHANPNIILVQQGNSGVAAARNVGLCAASGDYIWFVDADDLIKPNILGNLRKILLNNPCDRLILGGYQFTDSMSDQELKLACQGTLPNNCPWYDSVVWRSLLRQEFVLGNDLFFRYPDITHGEDGLYMYEVSLMNPSTVEIPEALYFYRVHSGSAETTVSVKNLNKKLRSYIRVTQILRSYYEDGNQKNTLTANKLMSFLWLALHSAACLPGPQRKAALNQLREAGLFPFTRPTECNLSQSYMADPSTPLGKLYDQLFLNLHTPWGFRGMVLLQALLNLKRKLRS